MSFNTSNAGRNNLNHVYTRNGILLEVTTVERDIGVQISSNLKPFTQCTEAARRAGAILTQISEAFLRLKIGETSFYLKIFFSTNLGKAGAFVRNSFY